MAQALEASDNYRVLRRFDPNTLFEPFDPTADFGVAVALDTETTGKDSSKDKLVELGMVTFAYEKSTGAILGAIESFNELEDPGIPIPPEATRVNNITDDMVRGKRIDDSRVQAFVEQADFVIAHNANFDRRICEARFPFFKGKAWACSHLQMDWAAAGIASSKLEFIAMCLRFFYSAHRAEGDCLALLHALNQPLVELENRNALSFILQKYREEDRRIWAVGSPFETKDALKDRDYRWSDGSKPGTEKAWYKDVSQADFEAEMQWLRENVFGNRQFSVPVDGIDAFTRFSDRRNKLERAYR